MLSYIPEEDLHVPLDFDDLLDIAHEFEFTHTITHIWPCEEPTELDDILAAIVPTAHTEETPLPLPSSTLDPVHIQEYPVSASISSKLVPLSSEDGPLQVDVQPSSTTLLRGWSPPNGSQFLDLDNGFTVPQPMWIPPWLTVPSYTQPVHGISQFPDPVPGIDAAQPQTIANEPMTPPLTTVEKTVDDLREGQFIPLPVQSSMRVSLEPIRARPTLQTNSNIPNQVTATPRARAPKSRPQASSAHMRTITYTTKYAKAPRGGIPPHIARTVTKVNILRAEKECKVMRDTFSGTTTGQGKKPSVLRRATKVEREATGGGGSREKSFASDENDGEETRAAKRKKA